ncbi:MAG: alpha/beta fold hydrolase [Akkermansiaceae bacterium]
MDPPNDVTVRGVCLFTHGQGDYSERYTQVLHPFTERGIRCIAFDLHGHGSSPGKRGHVGKVSFVDAVIDKGIEMAGDLPYGIAGHSMGGLLTLRHLTLALQGNLPLPQFCWVNSVLLSPTQNKANWFVASAKILAKIHPKLIVKTGATPELCQTPIEGSFMEKGPDHPGHQNISIGWGVELIKTADFVHKNLPLMTSDIPFLYTQGGTDLICPDQIAEKFINSLKLTNKTYKLFPSMRHETFAEPDHQLLFDTIAHWLDENV